MPTLASALILIWSLSGTAGAYTLPTAPVQMQANVAGTDKPCIEGRGVAAANEVPVVWCRPVGSEQMFVFQRLASGGHRIVNAKSGGCLDVDNGAKWSGARVLDWPCHGGKNQAWDVLLTSHGSQPAVRIRNQHSGMCLWMDRGLAVQTTCANYMPQWFLHEQAARAPGTAMQFKLMKGGLCASENIWSQLERCGANTEFNLQGIGTLGETFYIKDADDGQCLSVAVYSGDPRHVSVRKGACANTAPHQWRALRVGTYWQVQHVDTECASTRATARAASTHR